MEQPSGPGSANSSGGDLARQIADLEKIVRALNNKIDDLQSPVSKKYQEYQIAQYDDQIAVMKQRQDVFSWQLHASNVMMWVVVAVVLAGLSFSAFQLWHALKLGLKADGTIEVSATSMKITSSIVGVLVLGMSVALVLIFVDHVYSVTADMPMGGAK